MKALSYIDKVFEVLLCMLVILASITITTSLVSLVVLRYLFDISLTGMHETSLLAGIWLYMAGAIIAMRRRDHLVIDILHNALPAGKLRIWHGLLVNIICLLITCFFVYWSWEMIAWTLQRPQKIPILGLPLWLAEIPILIAAFTAVIYSIRDVLNSAINIIITQKAG
jgi:TRAP-type C4-dicarboxylate transport system permease small subunit